MINTQLSAEARVDQVRWAGLDDAMLLAVIDSLVNLSPWTLGQFEAVCGSVGDSGEYAMVIDESQRIEGFVVFSQVLDEGCIHNIAVHPSQQRKGRGCSLLRAALVEMKRNGAARCYLEVRASNSAARALYDRFSFQLDGQRSGYYPTAHGREDAVLMSRPL